MKRRTKVIALLGLTACAAAALGACTAGGNPYPGLIADGNDVLVRFDATGGVFGASEMTTVVDVYAYKDAEKGVVRLLAPGSSVRGDAQAESSAVSRAGYNLIGWYSGRSPRTDKDGNPLDDEGNPCTEAEQGYVYDGLWEFDESGKSVNKLQTSELKEVTDEEGRTSYEFTLYAAWAPSYTYDFYVEGESGWEKYGSYVQVAATLAVPAWNDKGVLALGGVPKRDGYSLTAIYSDEGKTQAYAEDRMLKRTAEEIHHTGTIDYQTGTSSGMTMPLYTTWREGDWYRVSTANQLADNFLSDGCYEILEDITFTDRVMWAGSGMRFNGTIVGEGGVKKITNLSTTQSYSQITGGVFGELSGTATIRDINFENVTLRLNTATRQSEGSYGLLAGKISEGATLEGVTVSGTILLGNLIKEHNFTNFVIGLICGSGLWNGISEENIRVEVQKVTIGNDDRGNPVTGWPVAFEVLEDGTLRISENEDPSQDPNPQDGAQT